MDISPDTIALLKEKFGQFAYPQFIKDFLVSMSNTRLFNKWAETHLSCSFDEELLFTKENRWLLFGYRFKDHKPFEAFKTQSPIVDDLLFGDCGYYQYETIKAVGINFEEKRSWILEGFCVGPWCSAAKQRTRPVPKYMQPIIDKLFKDYDEWVKR